MKYSILPQTEALTSGSDLWLLPNINSSIWLKKINWYLNLLPLRSINHTQPKLSKELSSILIDTKTDHYQFNISEYAPLLIPSDQLLPNKHTLVLPIHDIEKKQYQQWIKKGLGLWQKSRHQGLRIFLSKKIDTTLFKDQLTELLSPLPDNNSISLVLEP